MLKLMNKIFFYAKIFFLLVAFSFVLYIALMKMDFTSSSILTVLPMVLPFVLLLILFVFTFFLNWDSDNIFCNLCSLLSFIAIIIVALRTIFDQNIIAYPATINISFFTMQEVRIKILLYLILISNIMLIYYEKKQKNKIHS